MKGQRKTFKLRLDSAWFVPPGRNITVKVIDKPKVHWNKRHHKVINKISFGLFCNQSITYTVRKL